MISGRSSRGAPCGAPPGLIQIIAGQYRWHEARFQPAVPSTLGSGSGALFEPRICTIQDIYKCLHQGEFGVGHLLREVDRARARFEKEFEEAAPGEEEPLEEIVSPDGQILRINFRPYKAQMGTNPIAREKLFQSCVASAQIPRGSPERFFKTLEEFLQLNHSHSIQVHGIIYAFPPGIIENFLEGVEKAWRQTGQLPVYPHSATYRSYNAPAYRVVHRRVLG